MLLRVACVLLHMPSQHCMRAAIACWGAAAGPLASAAVTYEIHSDTPLYSTHAAHCNSTRAPSSFSVCVATRIEQVQLGCTVSQWAVCSVHFIPSYSLSAAVFQHRNVWYRSEKAAGECAT